MEPLEAGSVEGKLSEDVGGPAGAGSAASTAPATPGNASGGKVTPGGRGRLGSMGRRIIDMTELINTAKALRDEVRRARQLAKPRVRPPSIVHACFAVVGLIDVD
jgi:hypothetical protein